MGVYRSAVFALVAFALEGSAALAQDARAVEVTPYVALGSAGASPVGMMITFPVTSTLAVETEMAYRRGGGINALSSSASLLYFLPRFGQSTSYVAGGAGISQYGAPVFGRSVRPVGTDSRVALTVNAGGGLKIPSVRKSTRSFIGGRQAGNGDPILASGLSGHLRVGMSMHDPPLAPFASKDLRDAQLLH